MNQTNFLKSIGAFEATLNQVINKEAGAKNKAAYYLEFKTKDGRIVSQRLNKPFVDFDYSKAAKVLQLFNAKPIDKDVCKKVGEAGTIKGLQKLVGSKVVILVSVNHFNGRDYFQVVEILCDKMAALIEGDNNDPFSDSFGADPIGAALDTFEGSKVEEEISF